MESLPPDSPTLQPPTFSMSVPSTADFESVDFNATRHTLNYSPPSSPSTVATSIMAAELQERNQPSAGFFELRPPTPAQNVVSNVEKLMARLYSEEHLHFILDDHSFFHRFSVFISRHKPHYAPSLIRYMSMKKALKAIEYANSVVRAIRHPSSREHNIYSRVWAAQVDTRFENRMRKELSILVNEVLPAFIALNLVDHVVEAVGKDIRGEGGFTRDCLGELAEVFCLTDPSIPDNPIIYASEEFHKTTQYGTTYAIDRNCRFLQGPGTDEKTVSRISLALKSGRETNELLLNYRRDGSPFLNLLMCAPLFDDKGKLRYFIGAQVDVTHLVVDGRGIDSFRDLLLTHPAPISDIPRPFSPPKSERSSETLSQGNGGGGEKELGSNTSHIGLDKDSQSIAALKELAKMLSQEESEAVEKNSRVGFTVNHFSSNSINGGVETFDTETIAGSDVQSVRDSRMPGKRIREKRIIESVSSQVDFGRTYEIGPADSSIPASKVNPTLPGAYQNYILTHPYPSLRIMFVSPSLRIPGLLRTPLFSKIGGSPQTMASLSSAFEDGAPVTAKISWLPSSSRQNNRTNGRTDRLWERWMRATPLLGSDDRVGIWMIVLVPLKDNEGMSFANRMPENSTRTRGTFESDDREEDYVLGSDASSKRAGQYFGEKRLGDQRAIIPSKDEVIIRKESRSRILEERSRPGSRMSPGRNVNDASKSSSILGLTERLLPPSPESMKRKEWQGTLSNGLRKLRMVGVKKHVTELILDEKTDLYADYMREQHGSGVNGNFSDGQGGPDGQAGRSRGQ